MLFQTPKFTHILNLPLLRFQPLLNWSKTKILAILEAKNPSKWKCSTFKSEQNCRFWHFLVRTVYIWDTVICTWVCTTILKLEWLWQSLHLPLDLNFQRRKLSTPELRTVKAVWHLLKSHSFYRKKYNELRDTRLAAALRKWH